MSSRAALSRRSLARIITMSKCPAQSMTMFPRRRNILRSRYQSPRARLRHPVVSSPRRRRFHRFRRPPPSLRWIHTTEICVQGRRRRRSARRGQLALARFSWSGWNENACLWKPLYDRKVFAKDQLLKLRRYRRESPPRVDCFLNGLICSLPSGTASGK